jgi:hypothetical protein
MTDHHAGTIASEDLEQPKDHATETAATVGDHPKAVAIITVIVKIARLRSWKHPPLWVSAYRSHRTQKPSI